VIGLVDQRSVGWNFLCGHYQEAKTSSSPGAPGSATFSPGTGEKGLRETYGKAPINPANR